MLEFIKRNVTSEEIAKFQEQGFFTYKLLEGASLKAVQDEVDRLWGQADKHFDAAQSWLANALINGVHKESEVIREVLYRNPLVDVMTRIIGPNVKAASNQLAFKHPGDGRAYDWHQDNGYGRLAPELNVTCWLALDDVTERNGCLWVIPGSHKMGIINHAASRESERTAVIANEGEAIPVPLRAGEGVVFHGSLLHMSKGNDTDQMRRAYFFRYADADAVEAGTGRPRIGKLLRGISKFPEVNGCSELICHPAASELQHEVHTRDSEA